MKKVELAGEEWTTISVPAACANRSKHIPGRSDTFAIRRSPQQAELAILMPFLDKANVDYSTRQAAVWIVTDDADYDDLGILIPGPGGSRIIREDQAARAMRICDEAGSDVTRKAIWKDRDRILTRVSEPDVKDWLAHRR